jgi:hypothetical protein
MTMTDALRLFSILLLALSMADQRSSTTEKKSRKKGGTSFLKPIWDLIKRPKSANAAANPSILNPGSVPSVSGVHDPVKGNDAGTAQPTAAREFLGSISMLLMTTQPLSGRRQCCLASGYVHSTVLDSFLADVAAQPTLQILLPRPGRLDPLYQAMHTYWVPSSVEVRSDTLSPSI